MFTVFPALFWNIGTVMFFTDSLLIAFKSLISGEVGKSDLVSLFGCFLSPSGRDNRY